MTDELIREAREMIAENERIGTSDLPHPAMIVRLVAALAAERERSAKLREAALDYANLGDSALGGHHGAIQARNKLRAALAAPEAQESA